MGLSDFEMGLIIIQQFGIRIVVLFYFNTDTYYVYLTSFLTCSVSMYVYLLTSIERLI